MKTRRIGLRTLFCILTLPLLVSLLGCTKLPHQGLLPTDVTGTWTSSDPRYKDRELELSRAFVIIITGRHDPSSVQMIDRVDTATEGENTLFNIYSTDYSQGTHFEMKIQYRAANGGEIRFKNQPAVWTRRIEPKQTKSR